ncbi:HigA family addiction module antitoxin [Trichloromonas sp.]|uniref:HigA family addiction module antitoxin n=1 Tax=Trichloromonas sp. TaxID=3069249 RepID=UPI003D818E2B
MIPTNRIPTHPGRILKEEFLDELGVSQVAFSAHIKVPVQRINEIVRGKRGITSETAWLLAQSLETTPEFWLNLQSTYDLAMNRPEKTILKLRVAI